MVGLVVVVVGVLERLVRTMLPARVVSVVLVVAVAGL